MNFLIERAELVTSLHALSTATALASSVPHVLTLNLTEAFWGFMRLLFHGSA
jgi:hypothetical protein